MKGNKDKNAFRQTKTWKEFSKRLRKEHPFCPHGTGRENGHSE